MWKTEILVSYLIKSEESVSAYMRQRDMLHNVSNKLRALSDVATYPSPALCRLDEPNLSHWELTANWILPLNYLTTRSINIVLTHYFRLKIKYYRAFVLILNDSAKIMWDTSWPRHSSNFNVICLKELYLKCTVLY